MSGSEMFNLELQTAANIAELIGSLSIAAAVVFGTFQLREFRSRRQNSVAAELMRTFYSADLADAVTRLRLLPDGISASKLREKGPEYERSAVLVTTTFEGSDSPIQLYETFQLSADHNRLLYTSTVVDPESNNAPTVNSKWWQYQPGAFVQPYDCSP